MRKKSMLIAALVVTVLIAVFVFAACDEKIATYKVSLNSGSDEVSAIQNVTVVETAPEAPKRDGYRFEGWYLDPEYKQAATYPITLTSDITLYAKWTQLFTVSFEVNGGSALENVITDVIETSPRTYRDGFVFEGWYTNPRLSGAKVTFPYTPTKDVTLYAKWTEDKGAAEYQQTSEYVNATLAVSRIKKYFSAMNGTAIDYDSLLTTSEGTARVQLQANLAEGKSSEMMFRVTMQDDERVAFAMYVVNGEIYLDFGNGQAYVHLDDFKAEYLLSILQKAGAEIDLEELLGNVSGINVYNLIIGMLFTSPSYTKVTRVATGEIVSESYLAEVKVNSLVTSINSLLGMFDLGSLIGIDLNLNSLFSWLDSAIPQIKMYVQVDCENGVITNMSTSVADNASGSAGDELMDWKSTKIGYYNYPIYIDMPTDLEGNSREFSFSNLAFDIDLTLDAPEKGLDVAKLIGLFTDKVPLPENTLVIEGEFGFRLSAKIDLDLNYENAAVDKNLIALDLFVLGADGNPTGQSPALGIYYRDGAFYVSLSDLIPDYWNAKNIKIEANLDALVSDVVKLITTAIDNALGTDFEQSKSLSLSSGNVYEAALLDDGGEVKAVINPTISGLIAAVVGVIGLQDNVYVDKEGDSLVIDVNQKFFDVINGFMKDNKIVLPEGLSNMSLSVNFSESGVDDVVATVNLGDEAAPLEAVLRAHNFKVGFLEGSMQELESYIAERTDDGNYTSNLGELIYSVLAGAEINAHGSVNIDKGEYALGKILKAFGLDTGKDNPVIGITQEDYSLGIDLLASFAIDKDNKENSKLAVELGKTGGDILLGVYGYYENGVPTVLLDLSGIKTQFATLPIYKFEFDFAGIVLDLIDKAAVNGKDLTDFDLKFDLSGLIGGSSEAESLVMAESDGTAGGTELTQAGAVLVGINADKITASVAFATVIKLLESMGVSTGISADAVDLGADVMLSTKGVTLDIAGKLPKVTQYDPESGAALPTEYGNYALALETGTENYPISIGSTKNLDAAVARGKEKAAAAEDSLYDVVFNLANSMQASLTLNLSNEKGEIDIASMINNILAKEGKYIGFPINLAFDKSESDLYMDLKWDIHLDNPTDTKIYIELRYGKKKILSLGIQQGDLYVDLEGVGLFEFRVANSELATSLFTMLDEKVGVLRDTDLGALLTDLITGGSGDSGESGSGGNDSSATTDTDSAKVVVSAILGDISVYDGLIKANMAASTFDTIFKALLGAPLGISIEVDNATVDINSGVISLPVKINDMFSLNAVLELKPSEEFNVTSRSGKVLDASDGEAMARSLLKCLNMDFNLDIKNNNIESTPDNSYLRVRIRNIIEGDNSISLDGTSATADPESLVISVYMLDSEDAFNNTTISISDKALLHVVLDYSDDALGADGTGKNMKVVLAEGKFKVTVAGFIDVDLASIVGDMLAFQMDIVGMLSGTMQGLIDSLVFTSDGVKVETPTVDSAAVTEGGETEEEATASPFDGLDINELLSGGITVSLRSTGTLNVNAALDAYTFNKLIDDIMGGMVFGVNSTVNLAELAPDMFSAHYLQYVNWDRINYNAFWSTLRQELVNIVKGILDKQGYGGLWFVAEGAVTSLMDSTVYSIVKSLLPLPVYNEVNVGLNLVDGTLTNIYIEGYDNNEAVVNADGEVLEYHGAYYVNNESNRVENNLVYGANQRRNTYKTEINLYDCFNSVGDPDNTVDGSGNAGIINWGNMEFDMTFEPLAYEDDVVTSDYEFIEEYFADKVATYQQGTTVMKAPVKFYMWNEETQSYGSEITLDTSLGLYDYANNETFRSVTLKGKAEVTFPNGISRERTFTLTVQPNLEPALIDAVTLHAYDGAPSSLTVYFTNRTYRRVELSGIKTLSMPSPTIEGGTYEAQVTFRNGMTAKMNVEYLNSVITALGSNGESGVYELDLYAFDNTLDIMKQLPTQLFFSYPDGKYGAIDVEKWSVDGEILSTFAQRDNNDLSGLEFTAVATVGKGNLEQNLELTVRIKGKEVTSLEIDGAENTVTVNPYDYYLYAVSAAEGTTFSPWPKNVTAKYLYNGKEWSEDVKVSFSAAFDFAGMSFDDPGKYAATATLDGASYGDYFTWSREVTLDVQSNVIEGVYFDRALRRNTVSVDALAFNNMTAEEKQALFPSTAWVRFTNGYVLALPIRWTDRNGYALDFATLTFDASNYDVQMYAEIGFDGDAALTSAFYQRCAMTVKVNGEMAYLGEGVTVDPFGEAGTAQFPTALKVGNASVSTEATVTGWDLSGVDFSANGGEYLAAASFVYNGKTYSVVVPVTVTAREFAGINEINGDVYATYDETAGTVTVQINGNSYETVSAPTATATLTAKFADGSTASVKADLDFSAVTPTAETVYYDPALGTTAEEQGATAFTATVTVRDAAGKEYKTEFTVYLSIVNRIPTEPEEPAPDPEIPVDPDTPETDETPVEPEIPETDETPSEGENA